MGIPGNPISFGILGPFIKGSWDSYCTVRERDGLSLSFPTQVMSVPCHAQFTCAVFRTHMLEDKSESSVARFIHENDSVEKVGEILKSGFASKA